VFDDWEKQTGYTIINRDAIIEREEVSHFINVRGEFEINVKDKSGLVKAGKARIRGYLKPWLEVSWSSQSR
jgi:hypothetical protein